MATRASAPRAPLPKRRGSMVITAFFFLIAILLMVAGVQALVKEQIRQATTIQQIAFGKLQVVYLAEMGLNHMLYTANKAANVNAANPWPIPSGGTMLFNFKPNVAWVRSDASGVAMCKIANTGPNQFRVDATLTQSQAGTFTRAVTFTAAKTNGVWALTAYQMLP